MAAHTEDWGSTLGTLGELDWYRDGGSYLGSVGASGGSFVAADDYIARGAAATEFWIGNISGLDFRTSYGTLTGSQYHICAAVGNTSTGDYALITSHVATEPGGTMLHVGLGMSNTGRRIYWWKVAPNAAGSNVLLTNDTAGAGGARAFEAWINYNGSGTWSGTVTDSEPKTTTSSYAAGDTYTPDTIDYMRIGIRCYSADCRISNSSYDYTPNPTNSILYLTGTWATGSGTFQLGSHVLGNPSVVQDRAYYPGRTGGWASTVQVTLDDSSGLWSGTLVGTTLSAFSGTWTLQQYWTGIGSGGALGSWVRLLTGFVDPESVTYDYGARTARFTLESSIARIAQQTALYDGTSEPGSDAVSVQAWNGTIAWIDNGSVGIYTPSTWLAESGCFLWSSIGTTGENIRIGSSITAPGAVAGTGTIYLREVPDWMTVSSTVHLTRPWPWYQEHFPYYQPHYYINDLLYTLGLGTAPYYGMETSDYLIYYKHAMQSRVAPNYRAYGGEKLTEALNGLAEATLGFYSVNPIGQFRMRCVLPQQGSAGEVDFAAAYDSDWTAGYEPAVQSVTIDCNRNVDTGSFQTQVRAGGTHGYGENRKYRMAWLGSGIEAQSLCNRIYNLASRPRGMLRLRLSGSAWNAYTPGEIYAVANLPAHLAATITGTNMVLYSRTYDWADDLTELELVEKPAGAWAYWNADPADEWDDSGKVWF